MPADMPHPDEEPRDPRDGAAAIRPVTDAMMDHAAQEAAALADGVAHHTIDLQRAAADTVGAQVSEAASASEDAATAAGEAAERVVDATAEAARNAVEAAGTAVNDAAERAATLARTVAENAERATRDTAGAAQEKLSASADALGDYGAKVVEMVRTNMASTTALFAALVQAKSVPEALSINADHVRRQMETLASQSRELAGLAQAIALDALQPFKARGDR